MARPNGNALDRASYFVEELKFGPGPRQVEGATAEEIAGQLEVLLREGNVTSISGAELRDACDFYAESLAATFRIQLLLTKTVFVDGLMHGIALAAGLEGSKERLADLEREHRTSG